MKPRPVIPHCLLLDVIGTPRRSHAMLFVPALLEIDEASTAGHWFEDHFPKSLSTRTDDWTVNDRRAWSRISGAFELSPLICFDESDRGMGRPPIDFACIAVQQISTAFLEAWPFACHSEFNDYETYGSPDERRLGLVFSRRGPPDDVKRVIASAFWSLIMNPEIDESVHQFGPMRDAADNLVNECVDCSGTGFESEALFSMGEPCVTCRGTGLVSWRAEILDSRGVPVRDYLDYEDPYHFPEDDN